MQSKGILYVPVIVMKEDNFQNVFKEKDLVTAQQIEGRQLEPTAF